MRRAIGRDIFFPPQINVAAQRHGSEYGGWWICPDSLHSKSVVYSVGIGEDVTFDVSLMEKHGVSVHAFDPTPGAIDYVKEQLLPERFLFHPIGLAARDGRATFFPPLNPNHVSHTLLHEPATASRAIQIEVRRLSTVMRQLGHDKIDVLKMDIEGAEYEVIDDLLDSGVAVQQILVEFHHRFPRVGIDRTRRAVNRLNADGFYIFFAADSGEEYSFLRVS